MLWSQISQKVQFGKKQKKSIVYAEKKHRLRRNQGIVYAEKKHDLLRQERNYAETSKNIILKYIVRQ